MINFKEDTQLEIVESFNEAHDQIAEQSQEVFRACEPVDAEIVNDDGGPFVDLQFADGTMALSVERASFCVIDLTNFRKPLM